MKLGDTFLIEEPGPSLDIHLWIVLSDPQANSRIVIVNVTSWSPSKEQACVLAPPEHPWLTKKSCINYRDAKIVALSQLENLVASSLVTSRDPLDASLLKKVLAGAAMSMLMPMGAANILYEQGLLDDE